MQSGRRSTSSQTAVVKASGDEFQFPVPVSPAIGFEPAFLPEKKRAELGEFGK